LVKNGELSRFFQHGNSVDYILVGLMEKKIGSRGLVFEPHKKAIIDFFEVVDAIHFEEDVG
jgi:hypothetical protein